MPHTPTERSFDINFLRCGGKTKRRREAHELSSGLSFTTTGLSPFVVLNRSATLTHTHTRIRMHLIQTPRKLNSL